MRRPLGTLRDALVGALPEILTSFALLGGWALITWGIAILTAPVAWIFSGGALLLSLAGWRMLWEIASRGLYAMTRTTKRGR
ncbi:MAG: hypothetical protein U9Q74_01500 [Gemmatimonadota bacterium]|nr:hypothetical protein [Gemmatimonadota bacterium]